MEIIPLLNFDETFRNTTRPLLVPCDTSVLRTKSQTQEFIKYIFSESETCAITTVTCDCGACTDRYLLGTKCRECDSVVHEPNFLELGYRVWLELPDCLPPILQPAAFKIFKNWMKHSSAPMLLEAFLGKEGTALPPELAERFKTGVWYFYKNFDAIMDYLMTTYAPLKEFKIAPRSGKRVVNETTRSMRKFNIINRDALFARYFPALDSRLHVLSKEGTLSLADKSSDYILSMAIDIANIKLISVMSPHNTLSIKHAAFNLIALYDEYASTILEDKLLGKPGLIRHHIMGARCHFAFRAVITPTIGLVRPDEIHLPWRLAVVEFKPEILNLLINRSKMTFADALRKQEVAIDNYDEDIDIIFKTLIEECPLRGIPCLLGRNPSTAKQI